jgi:hypothetical protein
MEKRTAKAAGRRVTVEISPSSDIEETHTANTPNIALTPRLQPGVADKILRFSRFNGFEATVNRWKRFLTGCGFTTGLKPRC